MFCQSGCNLVVYLLIIQNFKYSPGNISLKLNQLRVTKLIFTAEVFHILEAKDTHDSLD